MLEQQSEGVGTVWVAIALIKLAPAAMASKMQKHRIRCGLERGRRS